MKTFEIHSRWRDDGSDFVATVRESHDVLDDDEDIFMYGLSEDDLKANNNLEFEILSYEEI